MANCVGVQTDTLIEMSNQPNIYNLESLNLSNISDPITPAVLTSFLTHCTGNTVVSTSNTAELKRLDLSSLSTVKSDSFSLFSSDGQKHTQKLEALNIRETEVTDDGVSTLLSKFKTTLKELDISKLALSSSSLQYLASLGILCMLIILT